MGITRKQQIETGILLSIVLLICYLLYHWIWGVWAAVAVLFFVLLIPAVFTPVSWIWFGFAKVLEKTVSKLLLIVVFYLVVCPVTFFRKYIAKHDTLKLKDFKKSGKSVFLDRNATYNPKDLEKQF